MKNKMSSLRSAITNKEKRMLQRLFNVELNKEAKEAAMLKNKLKQIMLLCRLFHKKVEITYKDQDTKLTTITAKVWLTTSKKVVLKDGFSIPAGSIRSVRVL